MGLVEYRHRFVQWLGYIQRSIRHDFEEFLFRIYGETQYKAGIKEGKAPIWFRLLDKGINSDTADRLVYGDDPEGPLAPLWGDDWGMM